MATATTRRNHRKKPQEPILKTRSASAGNSTIRTADSKGRLVLGGQFANRSVIIEPLNETEVIIKLARVIPEREAWLYENAQALASVRKGLVQARAGKLLKGPNLNADATFAAKLKD